MRHSTDTEKRRLVYALFQMPYTVRMTLFRRLQLLPPEPDGMEDKEIIAHALRTAIERENFNGLEFEVEEILKSTSEDRVAKEKKAATRGLLNHAADRLDVLICNPDTQEAIKKSDPSLSRIIEGVRDRIRKVRAKL